MAEVGINFPEIFRTKVPLKELVYEPGATADETSTVLPSPLTYSTDAERAQQLKGAFVAKPSRRFQINPRDLAQRRLNGLEYDEQPNGIVVFAWDAERVTEIAIKFLNPWLLRYKSGKLREQKDVEGRLADFYLEAQILRKLSHPHIVEIHGVVLGQVNGMEVPGIVLDKLRPINYRNMQVEDVLRMAEQIGAALDYLKSKCITHQDVNPRNIMMNNEGQFTLIDFGIADDAGESIAKGGGTHPFADPWQQNVRSRESQQLKDRADQYGLAMTVFYALTGLPEGAQLTVGTGSQMRLTTAGRPLPLKVMRVLSKATAYRREDRYDSCITFARELRAALGVDAKRHVSPHEGKHTPFSLHRLFGIGNKRT
jgi:serine/threonine protein kinase